jgi:AraC-like DNA-binding protein
MVARVEQPSIPSAHALHLAELVGRWGVTAEDLFAGVAIDREALSDPKGRLAIPTVEALVTRAKALTGEPGLGFFMGLQMRISAHGYLGFAAMASSTIGEALDVAVRFAPTRTNAVALRTHRAGGSASIVIEELAPLGAATDAIIFALVVGIQQIGEALTGKRLEGSADIAFEEPPYVARFEAMIGKRIRFGQPAHQLVFDASVLDLPLVMRDAAAQRLAREQCERELDELGERAPLASRVRAILPRKDAGFLSLPEAATRLGVSTRTLKRRLADEGTEFTALVDEQRRERALLLLRASERSMDEIAEQVGYSDVANFTRAFRRWTGETPAAYRRSTGKPQPR